MIEPGIQRVAVPFRLRRGSDAYSRSAVTSTHETLHGLMRLDGDRLVVQWRRSLRTEHVGAASMRTDEEVEPVVERVVALGDVAGAEVRRRWWAPWAPAVLVLRAADMAAFDGIAGAEGMRLDHPAELVLGLRRSDVLLAEEFAAELALAVAASALHRSPYGPTLPPSPPEDP